MLAVALVGIALTMAPAAVLAAEKFQEFTEVIEVPIPLNVVGKGGVPLKDLTIEDFDVFDNGKRQKITSLEIYDLDVVEPGETRSEIDAALPSTARRHFLFLFDLSFSAPSSLLRAREAAREFALESLHPTDLAAVATHSVEDGPKLLVTFTPDRSQVARAIDAIGTQKMIHLAQRDPLRFLVNTPATSSLDASSDVPDFAGDGSLNALQQSVSAHQRVVAKQMVRMEKSFLRGRVSAWSSSMAELAHLMDSVQGRKHLIFFSEGFDGRLMLGRQPDGEDRAGTMADMQNLQSGTYWMVDTDDIYGNTGLQSDVAHMLEEFRRSDCVLQMVDISGLRADGAATQRARRVSQDSLFYMANETGGSLYEDANDFGSQLERLLESSTVTYVLTIEPDGLQADGSYHRLKVKADLPRGAQISHRLGYYAPRPFEDLHPMEKGLLASNAIASVDIKDDLRLSLLVASFKASETEAYIPVIIEVEGEDLLVGQKQDRLGAEFYAYVTDERGEMRDFFTQLVSLDLTKSQDFLRRTGLKYYGHLNLPPGEYLIRVLVRNSSTGRTGVQAAPLRIPEFDSEELALLPPFFFEEPGQWLLVREKRSEAENRSMVYPFTINGEPYIPAARPALREWQESQLCLVAYNLGEGELEFETKIVSAGGQEFEAGAFLLVDRTITGIDGLDKLLASFRPEGLDAGLYTLEVVLTEPDSGAQQLNSIPFEVVLN